jgi:alpha-tubulin suppressor-like RCC1 family protein
MKKLGCVLSFLILLILLNSGIRNQAMAKTEDGLSPKNQEARTIADGSNAASINTFAITSGVAHSCAVTTGGGVKCWGSNWNYQLGDGTTIARSTPVDVLGLSIEVSMVSAGHGHTCVLTILGGVKCWGDNSYGQLGDGTNNMSSTPVDVAGLSSGVSSVSVGNIHTCARMITGGIKCWGWNGNGQLGDGTKTDRNTPVDVVGLSSGVSAVSAGAGHTCVLTVGGVQCWGGNGYGQLGDGTINESSTPVDVLGLSSGIRMVSTGGNHTCALTASGGDKCWGENSYGQLGNGTNAWSTTPVDAVGLSSGISAISAGYYHTCAVTTTGGARCWGGNFDGQLGDGTTTNRSTPVDVAGLSGGVAAVSAGTFHTCGVTTAGEAKCWGGNDYGQLGDGTTTGGSTPVDAVGLSGEVSLVSAGVSHTCAVKNGGVKCWGNNDYGQLGDGTTTSHSLPGDVAGLSSGMAWVSAGWRQTCAVTAAGAVKCWGWLYYDLAGGYIPMDIVGLSSGVSRVSSGREHACALTTLGGVKCWGNNDSGQLGDGTTTRRSTPVDVVGLSSGIAAVSAGDDHTCAVTTTGGVKCWGWNVDGQLGDGTTTSRNTPVDVVGLSSGVLTISAGNYHTCAVTTTGSVKCWGRNYYGQLGDGTGTGSNTPVAVVGLSSGVSAVSAGDTHTCAVTAAGGVKCWGWNLYGLPGVGTTPNYSLGPVDIVGLSSGIVAVSAGEYHTCAVTTTGGVKCWGSNSSGQLGSQVLWLPVNVVGLGGQTGFYWAIDDYITVNRQLFNHLINYSNDVSTVGDYFLNKQDPDQVERGVNTFMNAIDLIGVNWSLVGKGLNYMMTPGYQAASHASWRGWTNGEAAARHWLKPLYDSLSINSDRRLVFEQTTKAGLKYYAVEAGKKTAIDQIQKWLIDKLIPGKGTPIFDQFGQSAVRLGESYQRDLLREQNQMITSLPALNLTQAQEAAYQADMQARQLANQQILQQLGDQRDFLWANYVKSKADENNWFKGFDWLFFKWGVVGGATLMWDGPGFYVATTGMKVGQLIYDYVKDTQALSIDGKMLDLSLRFLSGKTSLNYQQVALNTVNGLNLIRAKDSPQIANAQLGSIQQKSFGFYREWPLLWWETDGSQIKVPIENRANFFTTFITSSVYSYTDSWIGSMNLVVEGQPLDLNGGEQNNAVIPLNMGQQGLSPDDNSMVKLLVLGATETGIYPVTTLQMDWIPTRVDQGTSKLAKIPTRYTQAEADNSPSFTLPIASSITNMAGSTQKVLVINSYNPFNLTVNATITQVIPSNFTIVDSGGGQVSNGTITWTNALQSNTAWDVKVTLEYPAAPDQTSSLPGSVLAFSDPNNPAQGDTYIAPDLQVQSSWPVETSVDFSATWKSAQASDIVVDIHNNSTAPTSGILTLSVYMPDGVQLWSDSADFNPLSGETQTITIPAKVVTLKNYVVLEGSITIDSATKIVVEEVINVKPSEVYLPILRR